MKQASFKTPKNSNLIFTNLRFRSVPIGNLYCDPTDEKAYAAVRAAWDNGMRCGKRPYASENQPLPRHT